MSKIVQMHRMSTAQASLYTGPAGEAIVDTGAYRFRVQDGVTPGGYSTLVANLNLADLADAAVSRTNLGAVASTSGVLTNPTVTGGTFATSTLTSPTMTGPILGTPLSGNLTNCTGYDMVDLVGLAAGVATFLTTPSSANLLSMLTTKTGTGNNVFSASPTFTGTVTGSAFNFSGNCTVDQFAVHTTVGGWLGNSIFETLSGGGGAVSAYNLAAGGVAFLGRVDSTSSYFARFNYGNTLYVGSITTDGSSVAYNTSCDVRLKTNIQDAPSSGAMLDAMQVRSWDWKISKAHQTFGFVAQELFSVMPSAVHVGDADPETIDHEWAVDHSKLVPLLVKEIQSLRSRLAILEAK